MAAMSDSGPSDTTDAYTLALDVLASTPAVLSAFLESLPADVRAWSPAPGEWSPREIVAHMLHIEKAVIPARVRAMVETDGVALSGAPTAETTGTPAEMLAAWRTARAENLAFLRALTPEQLAHSGEHPTYGRISAREHIIEWAYHDLEHMRQLQATLEARLYPAIGGFRALYSAPYPTA